MSIVDLIELGLANLWRTKLRTFLTILGVVIGVGALTSMISFGIGMQKNVTESFKKNDLFTSMTITSRKIDLNELAEGNFDNLKKDIDKNTISLNDSLLEVINNLKGVEIAFPEISFPVSVRYRSKEIKTHIRALPFEMRNFKPFSEMLYGTYFKSDSTNEVIIKKEMLKQLNIKIEEEQYNINSNRTDTATTQKFKILAADSIINDSLEIITMSFDASKNLFSTMLNFMKKEQLPVKESLMKFNINGIFSNPSEFSYGIFGGGIMIPMETIKSIPNLGFNSVWELLGNNNNTQYNSIYVRVNDISNMASVREKLEKLGLNIFAFTDELKEIKRVFLLMDSLLGAIGLIALVVASLGIINTMIMSILERTREIGIMKSIGGSERNIKIIFFTEASTIGFIGAIFGIALGWLVTRVANQIMNAKISDFEDIPKVELFYFPVWLIVGAIIFSEVLSLAAGLYPAIKAARVDPVKALRHD